MKDRGSLSSWEVPRKECMEPASFCLSIHGTVALAPKALIMIFSLHDSDGNPLEERIADLPIAQHRSISGLNYNYIGDNIKNHFGLYMLKSFTPPRSVSNIRMSLNKWGDKDFKASQIDLFQPLTIDGHQGMILKKVPKITVARNV